MMQPMALVEMSAPSLVAFATTTTLMNVTPGPAVMQVVGHSISDGWRPVGARWTRVRERRCWPSPRARSTLRQR